MKLRRVVPVVLFNLALALVLLELVALGGYFVKTGKIYYLDPPTGRVQPLDLGGVVESFRIHPYYGFTELPGHTVPRNEHGFNDPRSFPYRRQPGEFLVGLFGGSVAARLAEFDQRTGSVAQEIAASLGRRPEEIVVLDFAQGGFKQPQQLLIYTYFQALGQELDLVVNVDGFNEVALAGLNARGGIAPDMPSIEHMRALQDVTAVTAGEGGVERLLAVRSAWTRYARRFNRAWAGEAWELRFAGGFLVDWLLYERHLRRYHTAREVYGEGESTSGSWLYLRTRKEEDRDAVLAEAVGLWARSSLALHRLVHQQGGLYLHFVQPNQYFPTARHLSHEEAAVALSSTSRYPEFVTAGYPLLAAAVPALRQAGVHVIPLFELFDGVPEAVYADDCCHYTDAGQRLLAQAIAQAACEATAGATPEVPSPPCIGSSLTLTTASNVFPSTATRW